MDNAFPTKKDKKKEELIERFLDLQSKEMIVKQDELRVRQAEINANKDVAMQSIAVQEKVELKRADVFVATQAKKYTFWICSVIAFVCLVVVAMLTGYADLAIRIVEIGGSVILGYFAGVSRGKNQILEQQLQQKEN